MGLNSCLYDIRVMHKRQSPTPYGFVHRVFMFYLDLGELDDIARLTWMFGHNQRRAYNFCEKDHIGNIRDYLKVQGVESQVKRIRFLTNVRSFGYIFNPVSFYYCFDADEKPICVVVEIGNTFGELKYFYLGPQTQHKETFQELQAKYYYISPFTDLDNVLDFKIQVPDGRLRIDIDVLKQGKKFFYSSMAGQRKDLSTRNLLWYSLIMPFVTVKVIVLIHWHAAVLHFIKKVPHHAKEENIELQQNIGRSKSR